MNLKAHFVGKRLEYNSNNSSLSRLFNHPYEKYCPKISGEACCRMDDFCVEPTMTNLENTTLARRNCEKKMRHNERERLLIKKKLHDKNNVVCQTFLTGSSSFKSHVAENPDKNLTCNGNIKTKNKTDQSLHTDFQIYALSRGKKNNAGLEGKDMISAVCKKAKKIRHFHEHHHFFHDEEKRNVQGVTYEVLNKNTIGNLISYLKPTLTDTYGVYHIKKEKPLNLHSETQKMKRFNIGIRNKLINCTRNGSRYDNDLCIIKCKYCQKLLKQHPKMGLMGEAKHSDECGGSRRKPRGDITDNDEKSLSRSEGKSIPLYMFKMPETQIYYLRHKRKRYGKHSENKRPSRQQDLDKIYPKGSDYSHGRIMIKRAKDKSRTRKQGDKKKKDKKKHKRETADSNNIVECQDCGKLFEKHKDAGIIVKDEMENRDVLLNKDYVQKSGTTCHFPECKTENKISPREHVAFRFYEKEAIDMQKDSSGDDMWNHCNSVEDARMEYNSLGTNENVMKWRRYNPFECRLGHQYFEARVTPNSKLHRFTQKQPFKQHSDKSNKDILDQPRNMEMERHLSSDCTIKEAILKMNSEMPNGAVGKEYGIENELLEVKNHLQRLEAMHSMKLESSGNMGYNYENEMLKNEVSSEKKHKDQLCLGTKISKTLNKVSQCPNAEFLMKCCYNEKGQRCCKNKNFRPKQEVGQNQKRMWDQNEIRIKPVVNNLIMGKQINIKEASLPKKKGTFFATRLRSRSFNFIFKRVSIESFRSFTLMRETGNSSLKISDDSQDSASISKFRKRRSFSNLKRRPGNEESRTVDDSLSSFFSQANSRDVYIRNDLSEHRREIDWRTLIEQHRHDSLTALSKRKSMNSKRRSHGEKEISPPPSSTFLLHFKRKKKDYVNPSKFGNDLMKVKRNSPTFQFGMNLKRKFSKRDITEDKIILRIESSNSIKNAKGMKVKAAYLSKDLKTISNSMGNHGPSSKESLIIAKPVKSKISTERKQNFEKILDEKSAATESEVLIKEKKWRDNWRRWKKAAETAFGVQKQTVKKKLRYSLTNKRILMQPDEFKLEKPLKRSLSMKASSLCYYGQSVNESLNTELEHHKEKRFWVVGNVQTFDQGECKGNPGVLGHKGLFHGDSLQNKCKCCICRANQNYKTPHEEEESTTGIRRLLKEMGIPSKLNFTKKCHKNRLVERNLDQRAVDQNPLNKKAQKWENVYSEDEDEKFKNVGLKKNVEDKIIRESSNERSQRSSDRDEYKCGNTIAQAKIIQERGPQELYDRDITKSRNKFIQPKIVKGSSSSEREKSSDRNQGKPTCKVIQTEFIKAQSSEDKMISSDKEKSRHCAAKNFSGRTTQNAMDKDENTGFFHVKEAQNKKPNANDACSQERRIAECENLLKICEKTLAEVIRKNEGGTRQQKQSVNCNAECLKRAKLYNKDHKCQKPSPRVSDEEFTKYEAKKCAPKPLECNVNQSSVPPARKKSSTTSFSNKSYKHCNASQMTSTSLLASAEETPSSDKCKCSGKYRSDSKMTSKMTDYSEEMEECTSLQKEKKPCNCDKCVQDLSQAKNKSKSFVKGYAKRGCETKKNMEEMFTSDEDSDCMSNKDRYSSEMRCSSKNMMKTRVKEKPKEDIAKALGAKKCERERWAVEEIFEKRKKMSPPEKQCCKKSPCAPKKKKECNQCSAETSFPNAVLDKFRTLQDDCFGKSEGGAAKYKNVMCECFSENPTENCLLKCEESIFCECATKGINCTEIRKKKICDCGLKLKLIEGRLKLLEDKKEKKSDTSLSSSSLECVRSETDAEVKTKVITCHNMNFFQGGDPTIPSSCSCLEDTFCSLKYFNPTQTTKNIYFVTNLEMLRRWSHIYFSPNYQNTRKQRSFDRKTIKPKKLQRDWKTMKTAVTSFFRACKAKKKYKAFLQRKKSVVKALSTSGVDDVDNPIIEVSENSFLDDCSRSSKPLRKRSFHILRKNVSPLAVRKNKKKYKGFNQGFTKRKKFQKTRK